LDRRALRRRVALVRPRRARSAARRRVAHPGAGLVSRVVGGPGVEQLKGKYLLERPLGRGGMAEVFLGRTLGAAGFSHPVAIKRILAAFRADARFRAMFIAEARLSARLSHGNVVSVLDFDEDEAGRLFLVMELVDGT